MSRLPALPLFRRVRKERPAPHDPAPHDPAPHDPAPHDSDPDAPGAPRRRVRGARPRRRWWWRWLRRLLGVVLVVAVGLGGLVVGAYAMVDIPPPHPEAVMQSTVFYDLHGAYIGRRGPVDRQEVPLARVPAFVQDAVIAAENRTFRTDTGINPSSIARAVLAAVTGGERQGGSTITQQYVKNALLTPQRSLSRKLREALIAIKLDQTRPKNEILQDYLNTVYFGRGAAGVQSAARNYFGVGVDQLTLEQGAALASIINLPSYYERVGSDPAVTATLQRRWSWVLDGMVADHALTAARRAEARFPAFRPYPPSPSDGQRQYLLDVASAEAAHRLGITQDELARGGYTVHTTFDLTLQDATTQAVRTDTPAQTGVTPQRAGRSRPTAQLHTAVAVVAPGSGAVRALYGGADYARQPFDDATDGAVETGTALTDLAHARLSGAGSLASAPTITPVQMAALYAALPAGDRYAAPYTVDTITRGGHILYSAQSHRPDRAGTSGAALHTGHAGLRTAWAVGDSSTHLALAVALFAQHATTGSKPATPATLRGLTATDPTALAARIATDILTSAPAQSR
ncbi:transglycosylase domain-containing protein [Streptacidiphilus jiangxiensis]|uniref:Transglycosylase n=1 Tax=Streptacidiphilus jiangxiensis TaxID=235985 RepID=A0A1H8A355_STRJI|nr:transglycosylase domain-containing protein [Streptacidiphilus jiangxiensis]SEM63977.1 Transglycosylase [Streptacidiphilus jiangxiensis]